MEALTLAMQTEDGLYKPTAHAAATDVTMAQRSLAELCETAPQDQKVLAQSASSLFNAVMQKHEEGASTEDWAKMSICACKVQMLVAHLHLRQANSTMKPLVEESEKTSTVKRTKHA